MMARQKERHVVSPEYTGPDRRNADDEMRGPWWSVLLFKAEKIGYAGIAGFLIYVGAMVLRGDISDIKTTVTQHVTSSAKTEKALESLLNVAVQQCVNMANSETKRTACFTSVQYAPVRDVK